MNVIGKWLTIIYHLYHLALGVPSLCKIQKWWCIIRNRRNRTSLCGSHQCSETGACMGWGIIAHVVSLLKKTSLRVLIKKIETFIAFVETNWFFQRVKKIGVACVGYWRRI